MKPTAYIETSVVSYLTARPSRNVVKAAYQRITRDWWFDAQDRFDLVTSTLTVNESSAGDHQASTNRLETLKSITLLDETLNTELLAEELVELGAVPRHAADDAMHIAIAVTGGVDFLVTWNFKHIANAVMRSQIERVCRRSGYQLPIICAPNELMEGESGVNSVERKVQRNAPDEVISELRAVREAFAASFDYDISAMFEHLRATYKN